MQYENKYFFPLYVREKEIGLESLKLHKYKCTFKTYKQT